jgi:arylsulfatase A-like enzyme
MAYNGHPVIKTPNFDEAAATGLRFDQFYAAAPVCSPTRASVMTGRHPNRMGVFKWGYPIRPQETTIAEALKTAGYATGHFGKWHLGSVRNDSPVNPGKNGFDEWLSAENFYDNDPILSHKGTAEPIEGESSMIAAEAALKWIGEQVADDQHFLAVVWFGSPHSPHQAAEEDQKLYTDQPKNLQNFFGEITGMDRAFGKIRGGLTRLGIRKNTILWYCSDNGALPKVGSSGGRRGNKGNVYEGGLLVPAILEWPARITQPRVTNIRANTCDIYPTLLEITGVSLKDQPVLDGMSLLPLIEADLKERVKPMGFWDFPKPGISTPSAKWMSDLLAAQKTGRDLPSNPASLNAAKLPSPAYPTDEFPGHSAWIDGEWKLHRIANNKGKVTWELYNLAFDPNETKDLAETDPARAKLLQTGLEAWLKSVVQSLNGEDYPAE